jgi:hypothetical protein
MSLVAYRTVTFGVPVGIIEETDNVVSCSMGGLSLTGG